jgi:predicted secreted protein
MAATKAMGSKLYWVTESDVQIADLTSIGERGGVSEVIDATTLDSADMTREKIAGLKDYENITLAGIIKSEANLESLVELFDDQSVEDWKIETVDGATEEFSGFLGSFKFSELTIDGLRGFSMTIEITGKLDYTSPEVSV